MPDPHRGRARLVLRRFRRHRLAVAGLAALVLVALFAYLGGAIWRYDHTTITPDNNHPPSWAHPFGTDAVGHDTLAQVMRGLQQSLKIAVLIAVIATVAGTAWGAVAGYFGRVVDAGLMRLADVVLVVPGIAVAAALGAASGGRWWLISLILGGLSSAYVARVVRGIVLSLREQEFVEAARALGAGPAWIITRHLVPNALGPLIVNATVLVATGILAETALSFIGFGVQSPDTSLGLLVSDARSAVRTRPWLFYLPGGFIVLVALAVNFVGDGLRDALDPRQNRVRR